MRLNKFNLENKNILITGAAGSLGFEHSIALLEIGARVIMTDVNYSKLKNNKFKLTEKNPKYKIDCFKMDVSKEKSIINVLKKIKKIKLKVDVLINNACLNPKFGNKFYYKDTALEKFS